MSATNGVNTANRRLAAALRLFFEDPKSYATPHQRRIDGAFTEMVPLNELAFMLDADAAGRRVRVKNTSGVTWAAGTQLYVQTSKLTPQPSGSASSSPVAGTSVVINTVSAGWEIGMLVEVSAGGFTQIALVIAVSAGVSITIDLLGYSCTTPTLVGRPAYEATRAKADSLATLAEWTTDEQLDNNEYGWAFDCLEVINIDTSTYVVEDLLFLSAATAGAVTKTAPSTISVFNTDQAVGIVKTVHASLGKVLFFPGNKIVQKIGASATSYKGAFFGKLQVDSTTQVSLQRYSGEFVEVDGELLPVGASGLTLTTVANLLTNTGADSGGAMGTNTLYHLYVSNSQASFAASSLRASATAPSLLLGTFYLGTSGNAAHWRHVGWVRTDGSTHFLDDATNRNLCNRYNGVWKTIKLTPGYVDDNALTTFSRTTATWALLNTGTGDGGSYVSNGVDAVSFDYHGLLDVTAHTANIGIGIDTTVNPVEEEQLIAGIKRNGSVHHEEVSAEGYHTVSMLFCSPDGVAITVYADDVRNGAAADPVLTYLEGRVKV